MTNSASREAVMAPHPLPQAVKPPSPFYFTLNAIFRVFDPDSGSTFPFRPLKNATVNVLIGETIVATGVTGPFGHLLNPQTSPMVPPVLQNCLDQTIHFEVLGPASGPLSLLQYKDRTLKNFPIDKWSTRGLTEPEGHSGSYRITGPGREFPEYNRQFTVGCFINAKLEFKRIDGNIAPYPDNIELYSVAGAQALPGPPLTLRPGGILRASVFEAVAGGSIQVWAKFNALAVPKDLTDTTTPIPSITPITGNVTITGATSPVQFVQGERFGLNSIASAASIELYKGVVGLTRLPGAFEDDGVRLDYSEFQTNLLGTYQNLIPAQKEAIYFNWFLEFVAYRNLFVRAMTYLLTWSTKLSWKGTPTYSWTGVEALTLNIDDAPGGAFALGSNQITAHLQFILGPREDVYAHELTHAMLDQYIEIGSEQIYFPVQTDGHMVNSYSNEFFAFSEGIAKFMSALFVDTDRAYGLAERYYQPNQTEAWETVINFDSVPNPPERHEIHLGFAGFNIPYLQRESWIGLAVEGAFSVAMTKLWDYIWKNRSAIYSSQRRWVQSVDGDGRLYFVTNDPNSWLKDTKVQKGFAHYILDPIFEAAEEIPGGNVGGRLSTRRVVDRIEIRAGWPSRPWIGGTWAVISQFFALQSAINAFYISTVSTSAGPGSPVVRDTAADISFRLPPGSPLVLTAGGTTIIQLRGIRIPGSLTVTLLSAGAALASATVAVTNEYWATATFANLAAPAGTYDLLFESNTPSPPGGTVLLKGITVL